ncbi:MAG: tetratricopeptide repeat protein [Desulfobacter sp.]|nr:MAG: tetratricopeptide repeat protein [Desulfobacter sp.]
MNKEDAIKIIRDKYLRESLTVTIVKERILFFKNLLKLSKDNGLAKYEYWSKGYLALLKEDHLKAEELFKKSIKIDKNFAFAWNGLGNSYSNQEKYEDAIKAYKTSLEIDANFSFPWNGLGGVYESQRQYEQAIKSYKKCIEIDNEYAIPWMNLGNTYLGLMKTEEAIGAYKKSLEIDDKLAFAWTAIGNIYSQKQKYEKAIKAYKKSKKIDNEFSPTWIGLGNTYARQENYEEAIKAYEKAMKFGTESPAIWNGLGNIYNRQKKYNEAIEAYSKALTLFESEKREYWISYCLKKIKAAKEKIQSQKKIETGSDRTSKIIYETQKQKIEAKSNQNKDIFLKFVDENPTFEKNPDNYFEVLRRWNSYTPIIADNYHISKGGGYFLKINGMGIVVDPGFNFIDNFKGRKHFFKEIDAVFISHAHNDHTSDLESILTLLHKYNNKIKGNAEVQKENTIWDNWARAKGIRYEDVKEVDVKKEFLKSNRRKVIHLSLLSKINCNPNFLSSKTLLITHQVCISKNRSQFSFPIFSEPFKRQFHLYWRWGRRHGLKRFIEPFPKIPVAEQVPSQKSDQVG